MKKTLISVLALVLAMVMILSACGGAGAGSKKDSDLENINVALEFCLSGGAAWVGSLMKAATEVALSDYADDFAALGYKINPVYSDHEASNDTAALNFTKDVELSKAVAVISSFTGPVVTQAAMAGDYKTLLLNPGAQGDQVIGLSEYLFTTVPTVSVVANALTDYLYNVEGYRKLALLGDASSTAAAHHDNVKAAWQALGGEIVADVETAADATDFMSVCSQILDAGAEIVLLANSDDSLGIRQMTQFKQMGAPEGLAFINLGTGNRAWAAEFSYPSYVSSQKVYTTDEVIQKYESEFMVEGYPYEKCATYITNYYNSVGILYQLVKYCHDNNMTITGENLKTAFEKLGTVDIMGGSISLIEGNIVECPVEIYKGIADKVDLVSTYYEK